MSEFPARNLEGNMAASPNNTIITSQNTILTDANGNQWYINSKGQIVVNGKVDTTTGRVQTLAYENGQVWQMNTSDLWWSKTLPTDQWNPPPGTATSPLVGVASFNGAIITAATVGASVTDGDDNNWTITANGQVAVNGVADPTTGRVDELAYYNGLVWQKNADNNWYSKTSAAATWVQWTGAAPPVPIPSVSYNDSVISPGGVLIDANGNHWSLVNLGTGRGYQVSVDGAVDQTTANVVKMAIVNGTIWQENTAGLWYSKTTPASAWSAGTPVNPVPQSTHEWIGGISGPNDNASDAANWSSDTTPRPGDALSMRGATMVISGNVLAGDTLTVPLGAKYAAIDAVGDSSLNLVVDGNDFGGAMVYVTAGSGTLTMNAQVGNATLNVSGGTVALTGSNSIVGAVTFDDNLVGAATISMASGTHFHASIEIGGSVGSGLAFIIDGVSPTGDLLIDHPNTFQASIQLGPNPASLGHILFAGLQATSADLLNGVLQMFNGDTLVDSTRVSNPQNLSVQLHQSSAGVILTSGSNDVPNPGTLIPLKV